MAIRALKEGCTAGPDKTVCPDAISRQAAKEKLRQNLIYIYEPSALTDVRDFLMNFPLYSRNGSGDTGSSVKMPIRPTAVMCPNTNVPVVIYFAKMMILFVRNAVPICVKARRSCVISKQWRGLPVPKLKRTYSCSHENDNTAAPGE